MLKGKRDTSLDVIRSLACILVVFFHCSNTTTDNIDIVFYSSLLCIPCIGLFFMCSGYLLLPTKESLICFIERRMSRVFLPTIVWSFFYLIYRYIDEGSYHGQSWLQTIVSIPFTRQGCGYFWFLYAISGLYIVCPILSVWLEAATKREIQFILFLWGITLFYPYLRPFVILTEDVKGMLYLFSGYVGYFVLGFYIKRFKPSLSLVSLLTLYFGPVIIVLFSKYYDIKLIVNSLEYLSFFAVTMCFSLFVLIQRLFADSDKQSRFHYILENLSTCSFGIFLIHRFVIFCFHKLVLYGVFTKIDILNSIDVKLLVIISFCFTMCVSWGAVYCLSKLPYVQLIVGVRAERK